jgi:hypothetical protein
MWEKITEKRREMLAAEQERRKQREEEGKKLEALEQKNVLAEDLEKQRKTAELEVFRQNQIQRRRDAELGKIRKEQERLREEEEKKKREQEEKKRKEYFTELHRQAAKKSMHSRVQAAEHEAEKLGHGIEQHEEARRAEINRSLERDTEHFAADERKATEHLRRDADRRRAEIDEKADVKKKEAERTFHIAEQKARREQDLRAQKELIQRARMELGQAQSSIERERKRALMDIDAWMQQEVADRKAMTERLKRETEQKARVEEQRAQAESARRKRDAAARLQSTKEYLQKRLAAEQKDMEEEEERK